MKMSTDLKIKTHVRTITVESNYNGGREWYMGKFSKIVCNIFIFEQKFLEPKNGRLKLFYFYSTVIYR